MNELKNSIKKYDIGDGFFMEVEDMNGMFLLYLSHNYCPIKEFKFALLKAEKTFDEAIDIFLKELTDSKAKTNYYKEHIKGGEIHFE